MMSEESVGHWQGFEPIEPDKYFGFVYLIRHDETGRFYVGKKQYHRHLTLKPLKGMKRKRKVSKESDWKTYKGSGKHLKEFMQGRDDSEFTFQIVNQYETKGGLYYGEVKQQVLYGCLERRMKDGELYSFNRQIAAVKFVPKEIK